MKEHKNTIIVTTLVTLLPVAVGLLLWNRLPAQIPTHWNFAGEIDAYSGKLFAVAGLPLFLAAVHLICAVAMGIDPKKDNISGKVYSMVLWIVPVITLATMGAVYAAALGVAIDIVSVMGVLVGLVFVVLGNYMPKCSRNYTVGYRLPWTLEDGENWNKTHRLAGRLFVLAGLVMLAAVPVGFFPAALIAALVLTVVPGVYSYLLYRKQHHA